MAGRYECGHERDGCPNCGGETVSLHVPAIDDYEVRCKDGACGFSYREGDKFDLPGPCDACSKELEAPKVEREGTPPGDVFQPPESISSSPAGRRPLVPSPDNKEAAA